jgi:hypothetical protein
VVAHEFALAEVGAKQSVTRFVAQTLGRGEGDDAVRVQGVGRFRGRERPGHAQRARLALEAFVHGVHLRHGYGVLRGDQLGERPIVGERGVRVEFEGALAKRDLVAVLEFVDRLGELTAPEVAVRAHDIAPHVDDEGLGHG